MKAALMVISTGLLFCGCGGASSPPDAVVKTNAPTGGALTEMITQRGKIEQGRQAAEKLRRIYSNENQQLEEVIGK